MGVLVQNTNWPLGGWQANFATGANAPIPQVWDDLTTRVTAWSTKMGKQFELNVLEAGMADVLVRNIDEALNPANPGSPYNSGGKALKPYRWLRTWWQWPSVGGGNLLNPANDGWVQPFTAGSLADTAGFEAGTVGSWTGRNGCTVGNSTARAHSGSKSLAITWATTAGGMSVAEAAAYAVPLKSGTTYTVSAYVWIGAGPAVALWCNGSHSTSTTTTGAWQRVVCTFVAQDPYDTNIAVYAAGATTAGQQVWVDDVQLEAAATPSTFTTTGPTIYPIHTGYIERYPLSWRQNGFEGWTQLTSVDALGLLSRLVMQDVLTQEMQADTPTLFWPLWDDSKSSTAGNIGTQAPNAGQMVLAPMGSPTTTTTTFGSNSTPGLDNLNSVTFQPVTASDTYALLVDWAGSTGYTVGGTGQAYTIEAWFTAPPLATPRQMQVARVWAGGQEELTVSVTAAGNLQMVHRSAAGTVDATVTTPGTYWDTAWHQVVCTAYAVGGTVHEDLYVDGRLVGSATRTGTPMLARGALLGFDYHAGTYAFTGNVSRFAVYPVLLPLGRIASHWVAGKTGFAGDLTGARIARILAWARWKGQTVIPSGSTRQGAAVGLSGTTTAAAAGLAATTERGAFLALPDGRLALIPRTAWTQQTVSLVTFGENEAGGEHPYLDGTAEIDPTFVYNIIKVTRQGGNPMSASDPASAADYGVRAAELQTSHATDADALSMAIWLVGQYKDAHLRVPSLTIQPSANPALWPIALGTKFGDRVTWKRRTSAGLTIVFDGYVMAISHTVKPDLWTTTYQLQPADTVQAGIIGDPTYGVIGSSFIPGY